MGHYFLPLPLNVISPNQIIVKSILKTILTILLVFRLFVFGLHFLFLCYLIWQLLPTYGCSMSLILYRGDPGVDGIYNTLRVVRAYTSWGHQRACISRAYWYVLVLKKTKMPILLKFCGSLQLFTHVRRKTDIKNEIQICDCWWPK